MHAGITGALFSPAFMVGDFVLCRFRWRGAPREKPKKEHMARTISVTARRIGLCAAAALFIAAGSGPAGAAGLQPGEYACAGSGGTILIGLGFKLDANGAYTDLDGKNSGRVAESGGNISFVGGHLAGQVGRNVRGGTNFEIGAISCSRN
jgi:hypothetical protein